MDLSKLSDADLAALQAGDLSKVSDEGLSHLQSQSAAPSATAAEEPSNMDKLKAIAFGNATEGGQRAREAMFKRQGINEPVEGQAPMAIPAAGLPGLIGKGAEFLSASGPRRIATNAALGAAKEPDSPGMGALKGAATAVGGEALGGALNQGSKLATWLGGKLTGVSPMIAKVYAKAPKLADELFDMLRNDPKALNERAISEIEAATGKLQSGSTDPAMQKIGEKVAGQQYSVKPDQFEGTAAGKEVQRAHDLHGESTKLDVPVYEPYEVKASPFEPKLNYSKPETQTLPFGKQNGYKTAPQVEVSEPSISVPETKPQTIEQGLLPRGSQSIEVPKPMGDEVSMTGPQMLRAKRASSGAADMNRAKNPLGYRAGDDAEAAASAKMREAIRGQNPEVDDLNELIEKNLRLSRDVKSMGNPSRIYFHNENVGSTPIREAQQHFDELTGSNFGESAKALKAGQDVHGGEQPHGLFDRLIARPAGISTLRGAHKLDALRQFLDNPTGAAQLFRSENEKAK